MLGTGCRCNGHHDWRCTQAFGEGVAAASMVVWLPYVLGAVEMDMASNTASQIITPKATKSQFRTTKR